MLPDLRAELLHSLTLIRREALYTHRVNWDAVVQECLHMAYNARESQDLWVALRHALAALNDDHGFLRLPDADTTLHGVIGLYYVNRQIALVIPGSPAARAGLRQGDRLLRIQGQQVRVGLYEGLPADEEIKLQVQRGTAVTEFNLTRADTPAQPLRPSGCLIKEGVVWSRFPNVILTVLLPIEQLIRTWWRIYFAPCQRRVRSRGWLT